MMRKEGENEVASVVSRPKMSRRWVNCGDSNSHHCQQSVVIISVANRSAKAINFLITAQHRYC
jgi:hypothetical protein